MWAKVNIISRNNIIRKNILKNQKQERKYILVYKNILL